MGCVCTMWRWLAAAACRSLRRSLCDESVIGIALELCPAIIPIPIPGCNEFEVAPTDLPLSSNNEQHPCMGGYASATPTIANRDLRSAPRAIARPTTSRRRQ